MIASRKNAPRSAPKKGCDHRTGVISMPILSSTSPSSSSAQSSESRLHINVSAGHMQLDHGDLKLLTRTEASAAAFLDERRGQQVLYTDIGQALTMSSMTVEYALEDWQGKLARIGIGEWLELRGISCKWTPEMAAVKQPEPARRQPPPLSSGPVVKGGQAKVVRPISKRRKVRARRRARYEKKPENRWRLNRSPAAGTSRRDWR